MITIFTDKDTARFNYIVKHIVRRILCDEVTITKDIAEAKAAEGSVICYSREEFIENAVNIYPHGLLFQGDVRAQEVEVEDWQGVKIFFRTGDSKYDMPFDIFSASFYLISRYEEYSGGVDELGRFQKENSVAFRNGFLDRPMVDEWAYKLEELLVSKTGFEPAKKLNYRMHSSVLIEDLFKYRHKSFLSTQAMLWGKLFSGNFKSFAHQFRVLTYIDNDPYCNVEPIIEFHNNARLTPSFFILMKKGKEDCQNKYTNFRTLQHALRRNFVTGIAISLASKMQHRKFKKEIKNLEAKITKQRIVTAMFTKLAFTLPQAYEALIKEGIGDDFSMAYPDAVGFRASTCTPFRFFDLKHNVKTRLMVHSLVFFDQTIKNMGVHHGSISALMTPIVDRIKTFNGQFCCCVTNKAMSNTGRWSGWLSEITALYKYASLLESNDKKKAIELSR